MIVTRTGLLPEERERHSRLLDNACYADDVNGERRIVQKTVKQHLQPNADMFVVIISFTSSRQGKLM